ncbi:MAG TPA: AAA family ATPase, partial [Polyangiaceae bacterium]|nr:AAA family ATPase [Polyangiaceae bacterium]
MITRFHAENYGCLRNVDVELTPIHALIGPNDSGKSTILNGIRTLAQLASGPFTGSFDHRLNVEGGVPNIVLSGIGRSGEYSLTATEDKLIETGSDAAGRRASNRGRRQNQPSQLLSDRLVPGAAEMDAVLGTMSGARFIRFDPEALRGASGLIPESQATAFLDDRGQGLPGVYQVIQGRGDDSFRELTVEIRRLFPTVKLVRVTPISTHALEIQVELKDGTRVRAHQMSEGLLYYLAFAAIPSLSEVSFLLVEEPENGLHPARIADVMKVLRRVSLKTQVIIATHSPLVINCLEPNEVSVVTRPSLEQGTEVKLIRDTPNFSERSEVYALGELWLSYADGQFEKP